MTSMSSYKLGEVPTLYQSFPLMVIRASLAADFPGELSTSMEALRALCDLVVMQ